MGNRVAGIVRQRQAPLQERYRQVPAEAWINDHAHTVTACGEDAFHGTVVPANGAGAPLQFGIHRTVGGFHDYPNPGDLLSAALAACFDSTVRMVAEHLGIRLESLEVRVEAECDARGCLLVERSVAVGFQRMRCGIKLQTRDHVGEEAIRTLVAAAEHSSVIMQTLRNGVTVQTEIETDDAAAATAAAASHDVRGSMPTP